ncbi:hypothetical protein [Paracoccus marcusii]|uniref:hypothetical protein n=1 Tax=Paracoccus marcusii TaxID=59779 RepID=UPI002490EC0B|nr:hypothetical protein [Paracoccus marcusii]
MPELIEWPRDLMRIVDATYFPKSSTRSAGRGLSGSEQIIGTETSEWTVALTFALDFNSDRMRRFEAQVAMMRGRLNSALLPICDPFRYGNRVSPLQESWRDSTFFSDDTGWSSGAVVQPLQTAAAASAGDSQLTTQLADPLRPSLRVGDFFTHDGWLHQVVRRNEAGWVRFEPPLRRPIASGRTLLTDPPMWRCRFASDEEGRRMRERLRWGATVTVNFVEDFDR